MFEQNIQPGRACIATVEHMNDMLSPVGDDFFQRGVLYVTFLRARFAARRPPLHTGNLRQAFHPTHHYTQPVHPGHTYRSSPGRIVVALLDVLQARRFQRPHRA